MAPLTVLTSVTFKEMKKVMAKETLLDFPDFNKPFVIHTDASLTQLGSVISQEGKPIAFLQ